MKHQQIGTRERFWRAALSDGDPGVRSDAKLRLGRFLLARGEKAEALGHLEDAAEHGDSCVAPRAAWALAESFLTDGDSDRANAEFSRAAALASSAESPYVLLALASRCSAHGKDNAAIEIYEDLLREVDGGEAEVTAIAAYRLAQIHLEHRRFLPATQLMRHVLREGQPALRAHALSDLADHLLERLEGVDEMVLASTPLNEADAQLREQAARARTLAAEFYAEVIATQHADLAPRAAFLLAELRLSAGESIAAEEGLRAVAAAAHPIYSEMAEQKLAELEASESTEEVDALISRLLAGEQLLLESGEQLGELAATNPPCAATWKKSSRLQLPLAGCEPAPGKFLLVFFKLKRYRHPQAPSLLQAPLKMPLLPRRAQAAQQVPNWPWFDPDAFKCQIDFDPGSGAFAGEGVLRFGPNSSQSSIQSARAARR